MEIKNWHFAFISMVTLCLSGCNKTNTPDPSKIIQVTTLDPTDIEQRITLSGGTISFTGTVTPITAYGVCWSKTPKPTVVDNKTADSLTPTRFNSLLTGLTPNTTYYVRAYATIADGTVYGNELSFHSLPVALPSVSLANVVLITQTTAQANYTISSDGGTDIISRGICWSTNLNPTTSESKTIDESSGMGEFGAELDGLTENTIYYVRPYASNSLGTAYGNELTFATSISGINLNLVTEIGSIIPNVDTVMVIGILRPVTVLPTVLSYGVCWSVSPNPSITDDHSFGTDIKPYTVVPGPSRGRGQPAPPNISELMFHSPMTDLQRGITYYCRVFVTTSAGTGYGQMTSLVAQ
jgi:hypothetical protein